MVSRPDVVLTSSEPTNPKLARSARVAILHSPNVPNSNLSDQEIHFELTRRFNPLGARVFSTSEMTEAGMNDLMTSSMYDVIGLVGEAKDFNCVRRNVVSFGKLKIKQSVARIGYEEKSDDSIILAFAPNIHFKDAREYLRTADALVLCDVAERNWIVQVSDVACSFFESIVIPSMLNIDLADVKHIAKGIGLALNLSDDSYRKIISRLPKACLVARSALLHFSCDPDVRLQEVYSISKAIALKKGISEKFDSQINTHADARKVIRNVNVKMGIRMIEVTNKRRDSEKSLDALGDSPAERKRINLTAIFFGL